MLILEPPVFEVKQLRRALEYSDKAHGGMMLVAPVLEGMHYCGFLLLAESVRVSCWSPKISRSLGGLRLVSGGLRWSPNGLSVVSWSSPNVVWIFWWCLGDLLLLSWCRGLLVGDVGFWDFGVEDSKVRGQAFRFCVQACRTGHS